MRRNSTLKDVADRAGCHLTTVSKVLSNSSSLNIRPETRKRVLDAARELNYQRNALARGLKMARSDTIGFVVPDVANPIYRELIRGAQHEAKKQGLVLLISHSDEDGPLGSVYEDLVMAGRVDRLLVATVRTDDATLERVLAYSDRIVLVNNMHPKFCSVIAMDAKAVKLATTHLQAYGHESIAFIGGPATAETSRRRAEGYLEAQAEAEFAPHIVEAGWTERHGYQAAEQLIREGLKMTAIVAVNSRVALGVVACAHDQRITIPADLSIIGIQEIPQAEYWRPRLSTVKLPLYEMGRHAIRLAVNESPKHLLHVVDVAPELIERSSVATNSQPIQIRG